MFAVLGMSEEDGGEKEKKDEKVYIKKKRSDGDNE